jgi:hypothetical protein
VSALSADQKVEDVGMEPGSDCWNAAPQDASVALFTVLADRCYEVVDSTDLTLELTQCGAESPLNPGG